VNKLSAEVSLNRIVLPLAFLTNILIRANSEFTYDSASFDCAAKNAAPLRMLS